VLGGLLGCACVPLMAPVQSAFAVTVTAGTVSAVEGAQFSGQVATFSDLGLLGCQSIGSYKSTVTWGDDNSSSTATIGAPTENGLSCSYPVTAGHRFTAIGGLHFTVSVSGPLGGDTGTGTANVSPAPLSSQAERNPAVEGASFTATVATFTDGFGGRPASHYTASVDWGDGSSTPAATIVSTAGGGFDVNSTHTYANVGSYPTTVKISDPEGSHTTAASTTIVGPAPLSSSGVGNSSVEGQDLSGTVARFTDAYHGRPASHYDASVNWGDGSASTTGTIVADPDGGFDVNGSHTYPDAGAYTTTVTITDPDGGQTVATSESAVGDAPLSSAGIATNAVAGESFTANVAVFTDADGGRPASHYSATVDWGDGSSTPTATITADSAGGYEVSASHTYAAAGNYTTTVTITDPGGGQTTASSTATVAPGADPPPTTGPAGSSTPAASSTPTKTSAASILPTPKVGLGSPRLSPSGTTISISVTCPAGGASCQGVVRLTTLPAAGSKIAALRRGTTLGSVLFVLHPAESKSFSIHVASPTLRLLREAGTARVQGLAEAFGQAGSATSSGLVAKIAAAKAHTTPSSKPKPKKAKSKPAKKPKKK
jgi:PKD repeat protein